MTIAVCFQCGRLKTGAMTTCSDCGAAPVTTEELLYSVWLTDHHFSAAALKRMGAELRKGRPPQLDGRTREKLLKGLQEAQAAVPGLARAMGHERPDDRPVPRPRPPSLEEVRAIPELRTPVLDRITPAEWEAASDDPDAMIALVLRKKAEMRAAEAMADPTPVGAPLVRALRRRWRMIGFSLGVVLLVYGLMLLTVTNQIWAREGHYSIDEDAHRSAMTFSVIPISVGAGLVAASLFGSRKNRR